MNDELEVAQKAVSEEEVLAVVEPTADPEMIVEWMETKAQCCVDHLCGCNS